MTDKLIYPSEEEIVEYNKSALEIRVRKADSHKVLTKGALANILAGCMDVRGDAYDVAVCLLKGIIQKHPFASGNRRTAWITAERFLEKNDLRLNVDNSMDQAKVLQGIRENYYAPAEIKIWLMSGKIRKFER